MNYIEAMRHVHDTSPPGTKGKPSVRRAGQKWFVWYDPTLFLGRTPFGFRYEAEAEGREALAYQPDPEDVFAENWEVRT